jgi:structural maintenance of chromosome 1
MFNSCVQVEATHTELKRRLDTVEADLASLLVEERRDRQMEKELNEKLADVLKNLLDARTDEAESKRGQRSKNIVADLQKNYHGVRGRFVDLCKPTARKYEAAVDVVLGKHTESIIVEREQTAIDCINACSFIGDDDG